MKETREVKMLQKETPRSSKPGITKLKKPQKISAKNLDDAFDSVAEDLSPIIAKVSTNFSSISEVNRNGEISTESFTLLDPELSASSTFSPNSELTPSEITSVENLEPSPVSLSNYGFVEVSDSRTSSVEAQIAISALRKATAQVLNSDSVDSRSKKLLHALVVMAIEILETVPEEKDRFNEIVAAKTRIVGGFFFLCVFATVALRVFVGFGLQSSYGKPPPT